MTDGRGFRDAVERFWMPALEAFKPQMVFVSAGFDAHRDDPLAYLKLDDEDYRWVTEKLVDVAERHAEGRVVSTLEGGYNTDALGRCVVEHVLGVDLRAALSRRPCASRSLNQASSGSAAHADLEALVARFRAARESHVTLGDAELLRDEFDQRLVGAVFEGGGGDADLEGIAVEAGDLRALRARLHVDTDGKAAVGIGAMPHAARAGSPGLTGSGDGFAASWAA